MPTSLDGKWRMILVTENISGLTTSKPTNIQGDVDITFTPTSTTNGTFIGNTPTNDIWQNAYSVGVNYSLNIPCLSMTKVMEQVGATSLLITFVLLTNTILQLAVD
jgi:hypothetical protein